jgi:hypothetical protein
MECAKILATARASKFQQLKLEQEGAPSLSGPSLKPTNDGSLPDAGSLIGSISLSLLVAPRSMGKWLAGGFNC